MDMAKPRNRRDKGMGSIFQLNDGRWRSTIQVQTADGRVKPWTFTAKAKVSVVREHKKRLLLVESGGQGGRASATTVDEYLPTWIDEHVARDRSPSTVRNYRYLFKLYVSPTMGSLRLGAITAMDVQRVVDLCLAKGKSASTAQRAHATIRAALSHAKRMGLVRTNVAKDVRAPVRKKTAPVFLSPEQAHRLLVGSKGSVIEGPLKMALATGMRLGEILGIRWKDVDLEQMTISLSVQLRRDGSSFSHAPLKTGSSMRTLPITETVRDSLRVARSTAVRPSERATELDLVFLSPTGGPVHQKLFNDHLKALCEDIGVPQISAHKLRHTAASLMIAKGVPLAMVKDQLGHSTIMLTADTYGHMVPAAQRVAANALDAVLSTGTLDQDPNGGSDQSKTAI